MFEPGSALRLKIFRTTVILHIYSKPSVRVSVGLAQNDRMCQSSLTAEWSDVYVLPPVCQPLSACPPCEAAEGRSFSLVVVLVSSLCEKPSAVLTCTRAARAQLDSLHVWFVRNTRADTKLVVSCRFDIDRENKLKSPSCHESPIPHRRLVSFRILKGGSCCCSSQRKVSLQHPQLFVFKRHYQKTGESGVIQL